MQNKKAFSLVELIVVITILAILGTIAFLSLQGYSKLARDSSRISDLNSIETALELFSLQTGYYPKPTGTTPVTFSGGEVWSQGTIGESVVGLLQRLNKKPVDPLTSSEYTYSRLNTKREIELAAVLEEGNIALAKQSYAGETSGYAYVTGNYNGMVAKVSTGSQTYILAVPTIINADLNYTSYDDVLSNNTLVIDGEQNLPDSYDGTTFKMNVGYEENITNPVVYNSGNTLPSNDDEINTFITQLQTIYSGSTITKGNIGALVNESDTDSLLVLGKNLVKDKFGGEIVTLSKSNQNSNSEDWTQVDTNCDKPNVIIGDQVWAGCNSTLGNGLIWGQTSVDMGTENYSGSDGSCYDYERNLTEGICIKGDNLMHSSSKANLWFTGSLANGDTEYDNIWGKFYLWDDRKTACPSGWHLPTDSEWEYAEEYIYDLVHSSTAPNNCRTGNAWQCDGLGWGGHSMINNTNNLANALQIPLSGRLGFGRGDVAELWTDTEYNETTGHYRRFLVNYSGVMRGAISKNLKLSVRCIRD